MYFDDTHFDYDEDEIESAEVDPRVEVLSEALEAPPVGRKLWLLAQLISYIAEPEPPPPRGPWGLCKAENHALFMAADAYIEAVQRHDVKETANYEKMLREMAEPENEQRAN